MASTIFVFQADAGQTLAVKFEALGGSGTPAASYSATEYTTVKGWYYITVTEALVGKFLYHAQDAVPNIVANGLTDLVDDTGTYFGFDPLSATGLASSGSGGNGSGFTAIPWNSAWDTEVQSEVDDALQALGYTSARATKLDNLDGTVTSRQSEANASSRYDDLMQEHVDTQALVNAIDVTADVQAGLTAQGYSSARAANLDDLDATISSRQSESDASTRASTSQTEHDATQSAIAALASASTIAGAVWDYATASATTTGSMGELVTDNLDAAISSREAETDAATRASTNQTEHDATQTAVGSITASVSAGDIEDIADAVWQYLTSAATTSGSLGKLLVDNVNATISSREAETDAATRASTSQGEHDATQSAIAALNDISTADVTGVFNTLGYTNTRAGNLDNLDAAVSSREAESAASTRASTSQGEHDATQAAIAALDIEAEVVAALTAEGYTSTRAGYLDNIATAAPTAAAIADAVLDEALSGHQTAGTAGEAVKIARDQAVIAANNTQV